MIESRRLAPLLAATGLILLAHRALDLSVTLPQLDFGTPVGRARFLAFSVSRTQGPLIADLFLIGAAVTARHAGALSALGWIHLVGGGLCLLGAPWFLTEAGRLAPLITGPELTSFRLLVIRALVVFLLLGGGALLAGRTLLSLSRVPSAGPV